MHQPDFSRSLHRYYLRHYCSRNMYAFSFLPWRSTAIQQFCLLLQMQLVLFPVSRGATRARVVSSSSYHFFSCAHSNWVSDQEQVYVYTDTLTDTLQDLWPSHSYVPYRVGDKTQAVCTLSCWIITYFIIHVVFVSWHFHPPFFRAHPWPFYFLKCSQWQIYSHRCSSMCVSQCIQCSSRWCFAHPVLLPCHIARVCTSTTFCAILLTMPETHFRLQFPVHRPCDPRHAYAPPSLADEATITRVWCTHANSYVWYVTSGVYDVTPYLLAYSVLFVQRSVYCTEFGRVSLDA